LAERGKEQAPGARTGKPDVFISYASHDSAVAEAACDALERAGVTCWIAPRDVMPGAFYADEIVHAIDDAKAIVLILSQHAAESPHVQREVERAASKRHPVVSLRIDHAPLPPGLEYFLNASHWLDASGGDPARAMPKLVSATQVAIGVPGAMPAASPSSRDFALSASPQSPNRTTIVVASLVGLAITVFAIDRIWISGGKPAATQVPTLPTSAPAFEAAVPAIPEKSVAVLPFIDMSEMKDQEYFSDGLSEELIDMLTKVPDLRVPARTSSFYFKGKQATIADIAKALGVSHVLEGSVRKSGKMLRVTAQLIRVDNGYHIWSETYDRKLDDIFKVQDDIADEVVKALKASLLDPGARRAVAVGSTEAYNFLLQGRYFAAKRTLSDMGAAIEYFNKAVQRDPGYAEAWAALAYADTWQAQFGAEDVESLTAKARLAAKQAILLNPKLPEAHATMALIHASYDFDWASASSETELALSLDRSNPDALLLAGQADFGFGRMDQAIARYREVLSVDPLRADAYMHLGSALYSAGRFDEAADALRATMRLNPEQVKAHFLLALTELARGDAQAARATVEAEQAPWYRLTGLAIIDHSLGRKAESDSALAELRTGHGVDAAVQIAEACAYRGERDEAFDWLNRAYRQRDAGLRWLKVDPLFATLRSDARYKALLRKMNLSD
jgi:TolB-like protein/cytochrome c-type biogenesis protein CcmH/NrfG